jgi:hypothetical protein
LCQKWTLSLYYLLECRGAEILQKSWSHFKLVHTRRVTQSKFNTEDSKISDVTIHNLVIMATGCLGFAHFYSMQFRTTVSNFRCCKLLCGQFFFKMLQSASMKSKKIRVKVNALLIGVLANVNCLWLLRWLMENCLPDPRPFFTIYLTRFLCQHNTTN